MLSSQSVLPVGKAYARAVYSKRLRCHVVPMAFVRVACRVAALVASKRRVRAAFADYMVSDHEPAFSDRRKAHDFGVDAYASTCDRQACGLGRHGYGYQGGGPLDAPEMIAAGSVVCLSVDIAEGGLPAVIERGGCVESVEVVPFSARRGYWVERIDALALGLGWRTSANRGDWVGRRGDWSSGCPLDAPVHMPAGAVGEIIYGDGRWRADQSLICVRGGEW